jgi:hypothetical protein
MRLRTRIVVGCLGAALLAGAPSRAQEPEPDPATAEADEGGAVEGSDAEPEGESESADLEAYWSQRLARAARRIEVARERATEAEADYARARHDDYPRGEALAKIESRHRAAQRELEAAEAALPRLVEQARRAGVAPGVLREYWDDEDEADEPS